jgi:histone acetyltransferase (RNA polymerase elongator complex component)
MGERAILPVFLEHQGCAFRCGFCNQQSLVGVSDDPFAQIDNLLYADNPPGLARQELAFYGGDFLSVEMDLRTALLEHVRNHRHAHTIAGLRASVRPDSLNEESAKWLRDEGFVTVELGAQCLDDDVLAEVNRGHDAEAVGSAVAAARSADLRVGLQIMLGLPGQTIEKTRESHQKTEALRPDFLRLFPTLVVAGTQLEKRWEKGEYEPLTLEEAVRQATWSLAFFTSKNLKVIQIGLHPSEPLVRGLAMRAGPFHPRFGELVRGRLARVAVHLAVGRLGAEKAELVRVAVTDRSQVTGQGRKGLNALRTRLELPDLRLENDPELAEGTVVAISAAGTEAAASTNEVWNELGSTLLEEKY